MDICATCIYYFQIYTEYVQASEALFAEKEENKKLNEYMNQILKVFL